MMMLILRAGGKIIETKENYSEAIFRAKRAREIALVRHDRERISNRLNRIYNRIITSTQKMGITEGNLKGWKYEMG